MFFVIECWLGGMMINFQIICKFICKMVFIDKMKIDGIWDIFNKCECFFKICQCEKLEKMFGFIVDMICQLVVIFIVDILKEYIVLNEVKCLGIFIFVMVDINFDLCLVDFFIFVNDDVIKFIFIIFDVIIDFIKEGLDDCKVFGVVKDKEEVNEEVVVEKIESLEE